MGFAQAVRSCLQNYITFSGRAPRSEYWFWILFVFLGTIVLSIVDGVLGMALLTGLFSLGTILPGIAVGVRRLHDLDKSGWWIFAFLIPLVGVILMLIWYCSKGTAGDNRFGADKLAS